MRAFGLAAMIAGTLSGQQAFTVPAGLAAKEGNAAVVHVSPFAYAQGRFQYTDAAQRGTARPNLNKLQLRRDGREPGNFPARTLMLAVVLAECDAASLTTTFAANYFGAPTTVFSRKQISLPDLSQAPAQPPAPWSLQLPFDLGFSYSGQKDLLWELQLDSNSATGAPYGLDAVEIVVPGAGSFFYNGLVNCTTPLGAFDIYALPPQTSQANLTTLAVYAERGPSAAAGVLAVGTSDPNLVGLFCAPLRTSAEALLPVTTNALGGIGSAAQPIANTFWFPGPMTLHLQFAALDPTQAPWPGIALSDAAAMTIVEWVPRYQVSRLSSTLAATAATGTRSSYHVPVAWFGY